MYLINKFYGIIFPENIIFLAFVIPIKEINLEIPPNPGIEPILHCGIHILMGLQPILKSVIKANYIPPPNAIPDTNDNVINGKFLIFLYNYLIDSVIYYIYF